MAAQQFAGAQLSDDRGPIDVAALVAAAREAQGHAYAPYSGYRVGAALLGHSGTIYRGCNVENASYGATICAERSAVSSAVAAGERTWRAIAVYADGPRPPVPCGLCRQVLAEFGPALRVIAVSSEGARHVAVLADLLPEAFTAEALPEKEG